MFCSVDECAKKVHAQGLCSSHYARKRRYGNPLGAPEPTQTFWERLWSRVEKTKTCWLWTGYVNDQGYGILVDGKQKHRVHVVVYEKLHGKVPQGLELDHVSARGCVHKNCCNPDHLEAVTHVENLIRGNNPIALQRFKTHCNSGHEYNSVDTLYSPGGRVCKICRRARDRKRGKARGVGAKSC